MNMHDNDREARLQAEAEAAERQQMPPGPNPAVNEYRLVMRALRQPPSESLPMDFAARVARRVLFAEERGSFEDWMVTALMLVMAAAGPDLPAADALARGCELRRAAAHTPLADAGRDRGGRGAGVSGGPGRHRLAPAAPARAHVTLFVHLVVVPDERVERREGSGMDRSGLTEFDGTGPAHVGGTVHAVVRLSQLLPTHLRLSKQDASSLLHSFSDKARQKRVEFRNALRLNPVHDQLLNVVRNCSKFGRAPDLTLR